MPETRKVLDSVTLHFDGNEESETDLDELRAVDVADVLRGLAGIVGDFDKAGAFHSEGPADSQVLVRPPREGSFVIEAIRVASENWEAVAAATGIPSIAQLIEWSTRSARAEVEDFEHLENGNVKISWQDNTVNEVPRAVWDELNKRKRRRKKQLREIMAPLSDDRVAELEVSGPPADDDQPEQTPAPDSFSLNRADYDSVAPEDEVEESANTFEVDAQMQTIDFGDPTKWRVRAAGRTRKATVEDADFLSQVTQGLAISNSDIFRLQIREDKIVKNGRERTTWTVLKVIRRRRRAGDDDG
ncbi:hypothetical protein SEA_BAXTERFOX_31 [Gordonia phage BaxterFox]|uniref:Uncharacterized protein n=2 Tax=Baxterfoxvirus TaxID=3044672 RepID=A0A7G8LG89_9CAUD|nr:hypothetical protein SEA_BAXTERFOX_31 [Gordonia phage BaxterFox]YP_010653307.1 hypothetical protein PP492_gp32 [Gordonia phage Ohgeesy]AMS03841.1 hypothetical protein SEA_BAXTERFOX_31 [Gordonia phage BaxterFox]QNJ56261.1 hypothetical protein SEA_OHGEESY_32 [Gordonia phage Ohgeesy]